MLKFQDTKDAKLYITGCTHAYHKQPFIWQKRGYNSPEEHTQGLIDTINSVCTEKDTLLILGDLTLNASYDDFNNFIFALKPQIWNIYGNHNHPIQNMYEKFCIENFGYEVIGYKWLDKITMYGHYLELRWNGQWVNFFHYPIAVFNKMHHNSWNLCSHSHGSYIPSLPTDFNIKQLDCGWDVFAKPIGFKDIQPIMNRKNFTQKDHHDKNTN